MMTTTLGSIEFLERWRSRFWTLTAIHPNKKIIRTKSFTANEKEEAYKWIDEHNGTFNLYFNVNSLVHKIDKKASRQEIASVDWLHVDIDPEEGETPEKAQKRILDLINNYPIKPTVIIFSGGGYQAFWRLEESIPIEGSLEKAEEAKRYNMQIERDFNADNCHNIDRIMRLPGTKNIPNAEKKKKGRKVATSFVVEWNEVTYSLDTFTPAPDIQDTSASGFSSEGDIQIEGNIRRLMDIDELNEWNVADRYKVIAVQGYHPDEGGRKKDNSRSSWVFDLTCGLARQRVPDQVIFSILTDPDLGISSSILEKGSGAEKYAIRQINRAKEYIIDPRLEEMNGRHAVIGNIGGKCRVIEEVMDHALGRPRLTRQTFEDVRNRYMNQTIQSGDKDTPLGKWWLAHPKRRQYDTITFSPNHHVPGAYNLWRGFAYEPVAGNNHESFLRHLKDNICQGNDEYYDYLIGWLANTIQHPDYPGQTAIVMRGKQGTGKSFFVKHFGSLLGRHYMQVSDPKHLVGSFNSHLRDCVVLFGDEAFYAGDKKHESVLKMLITEELITIEAKGVDAEVAPNCTHVLLASNNSWVVPAGAEERRFFVLDIGDKQMQNHGYFKRIHEDMENGGYGNLLYYLLRHPLKDFDVRRVPRTQALQDQKLESLDAESSWWLSKLEDEYFLPNIFDWEDDIPKKELYADYMQYAKDMGTYRKKAISAFGKMLQNFCPPDSIQTIQKTVTKVDELNPDMVIGKHRPYFYRFPSLEVCRQFWEEKYGQ